MNYYLYRHIRLDKNEPFYIGISEKSEVYNTFKQEYSRAYSKQSRSKFWKRIVKKTKYIIEIIYECNNKEEIGSKEVEFIKLYGRRNLGLGPLVNLTDRGDILQKSIKEKLEKQVKIENIQKKRKNN